MSEQSPVNAVALNADQALGMGSCGVMQGRARDGQVDRPWLETAVDSEVERARQLRQRLELTALAINTGAPLTTAEVTLLLGARPGSEQVERGGLMARRVSRNVGRLSKLEDSDRSDRYDGFRRRLCSRRVSGAERHQPAAEVRLWADSSGHGQWPRQPC